MFLKTAPMPEHALLRRVAQPGGGSMMMRMTAWYAGSSFLLILIATAFLYWSVAASLRAEDRQVLISTAANLRYFMSGQAGWGKARRMLASSANPFKGKRLIWIRILGRDGRTELETGGMDQTLPVPDFPALTAAGPHRQIIRIIQTRSGKLFQTLSAHMPGCGGEGRIFQIAMDRTDDQRLLTRYRERLLLVLTASLAFCATIGFAIARSGMRPVEHIIITAENIRSSTLHERIELAGLPNELQSLAGTFNSMLDRLEESFAQISQFSADVAHELRTPVNNLRGEIEVALGRARSLDEYRDVLGSALEECARIGRVIQSLLFLARAETAGESPHFELLDLNHEVASIVEFYEAAAAEAGVVLSQETPEGSVALLDRTLFQQAIGNLVANAIAHTPGGGHVALRSRREGAMLRVEVVDTGKGIAPEHLPHVFNRFYRADRARSSTGGNSGLGLALVRSIAALHGGQVEIESELGQGTRVVLALPLMEPPQDHPSDPLLPM